MRKFLSVSLLALSTIISTYGQTKKPKLVIGIVVDQMRYDYLQTFAHLYGEGGFKRLMSSGQVFHSVHYNYIPTFTGPGHTSVYTGTTPAVHGIAANDWYDRATGKTVYCTDDTKAKTVGNAEPGTSMSPANLLVPTVTDQFKSQPGSGKVIAVALKDRSSILPGGKKADAAYWFDGKTGNFITSDYYMKTLPAWATEFNGKKLWDGYLNTTWDLSLPVADFRGVPDSTTFEGTFKGTKPVFPYNLKEIRKQYSPVLINTTPYGNSFTLDFAKAAIKNEQLGTDDITDFLAISFSSTDYVGHKFGPHSLELMDTYTRLDRELATFFIEIDQTIGWDNVVIFLTADHGACDVPGFAKAGGFYNMGTLVKTLGEKFTAKYGVNLISHEENDQLYINKEAMKSKNLSMEKVYADIMSWAKEPWLLGAFMPDENQNCDLPGEICSRIRQGFARGRSGDIWLIARPNWLPSGYEEGGTTHGSPYVYDTHAPFIVAGYGIKHADRYETMSITDIAPSIATLLGLPLPPGATGKAVGLK